MAELNHRLIDYYSMIDGIDTMSSAVALGRTKLRDAQNINYFPIGGFSWRKGYARLESASTVIAPVTGLYMARFSSPANVAFRVVGNRLEKMDSLDGTWDDITGALTITSGKDNLWNFAILNDVVVLCNDTDTNLQVNSSLVAAALAGSPAFTSSLFVVEFRGYMFYGNTVESGTRQHDRLRFSDLNAPNTFTLLGTNNFIDVAKKQGGDLRGAISYGGRLYCFKRHGIYSIEFQPARVNSSGVIFPFTENPNPVVEGVGTQSQRSICKFTTPATHKTPGQELVFFVDQLGVPRLFDGESSIVLGYSISMSRDPAIPSLADMDRTRIRQIFTVNYPERSQVLCWMTEDGGQHDTVWVLDYSVGFAWSRFKFADDFNCGAVFEKNDGTFRVYMGTYDGKVMEYDTTQADNGTTIRPYAIPGDAVGDSPVQESNWPQIELRGVTGTEDHAVTVEYFKNGSSSVSKSSTLDLSPQGFVLDEDMLDIDALASDGVRTSNLDIGMDAKSLRTKFSCSAANATFFLEGYTLFANPLGWNQSE